MKKYTVDEAVRQFEESGEIMHQAALTGDYKTGNKEGKKLAKLFKVFASDSEFGYCCIDRLLQSHDVLVRTEAAAYSLALLYNIDYAVSVLEEISANQENGIIRLNAEMTLKVWREKGSL